MRTAVTLGGAYNWGDLTSAQREPGLERSFSVLQ